MLKKEGIEFSKEQFKVYGHETLKKVRELIKEGNVNRIIIKDEKNRTVIEVPVNLAVLGTLFSPVLAAVGAATALLAKCTIEVERRKTKTNYKKKTSYKKKTKVKPKTKK